MRRAVTVLTLLIVALAFTGCAANNAAPGGASKPATTPKPTPAPPRVGELVRVGSLDLTVLQAGPVDTTSYNQFNDANFAVRIAATNARGAKDQTYDLNMLAFKVVDASGVAYAPTLACAGCPDELTDVGLTAGGHIERTVYFKVSDPSQIVALQYAPLASTNRAVIALK